MIRKLGSVAAVGTALVVLAGCASSVAAADVVSTASTSSVPPTSVMVDEQAMSANRTIGANIMNASNLTQVVALIQKANMVEALNEAGPLTILAPNDDAFTRVPAETSTRMNGDNALLTRALSYHVLRGKYTRSDIVSAIRSAGGTAIFNTVNGATLRARMQGDIVVFEGNNKSIAYFQQVDIPSSNGVIHVINGVLIPPALG